MLQLHFTPFAMVHPRPRHTFPRLKDGHGHLRPQYMIKLFEFFTFYVFWIFTHTIQKHKSKIKKNKQNKKTKNKNKNNAYKEMHDAQMHEVSI